MNKKSKENNALKGIVKCDYCNSEKHVPILQSKDYVFNVVQGKFTICRCSKCKLVFTNPRIMTEELSNYYSKKVSYGDLPLNFTRKKKHSFLLRKDILTDYFQYPFLAKNFKRKLVQFPNYLRKGRRWKKRYIVPPYIENGNILEAGCSYGVYLYNLREIGWKVKGVELNRTAVEFARKHLKLDVENKRIEDFKSDKLFDIIYLNMVLEHVESPKLILKKLHSLLKPNGKLIFSIPDFSGIEVRIFKKYAYTLHLPFHLYHFTPSTIKNYLRTTNFKIIKIIHQNFDRDFIAPISFILKDNPDKILLKLIYTFCIKKIIRKTLIKIMINIFATLGITSRMTVIASKE